MKKLKIFLLLGILLCLGFTLSPEVHAQNNGPKAFEEGDVLPATTRLHITSVIKDWSSYPLTETEIITTDEYLIISGFVEDESYTSIYIIIDGQSEYSYDEGDYNSNIDIIIDTSSWTQEQRTVIQCSGPGVSEVFWEDLNASKPFEISDELPAGYIKISWDFTDKFNDIFDEDVTFWIVGDGDPENNLYIEIEVWDYGEEVRFTINQEEFHIDRPGETVISIPIPYTITQVDNNRDYDYYISIGDALMWEVVTEEEFNYSEAYQDGYSDGYYLGYEHAREIYGYYDSKTNEWLSVSEYLNRYGTDKPGSSDFYANFDKYFIPAMIIVFGGAIVLTILKVFKGRE